MASKCPNCGSLDTQVEFGDNTRCVNCGRAFNSTGDLVAPGPDQTTRDALTSRAEPRTVNVVGNLADVQRSGAQAVSDPKNTAVPAPPGVDPKNLDEGGIGVFTDTGDVEPAQTEKPKAASKK